MALAMVMVGMSLSLFTTSLYEPLGITPRDRPWPSRNLMQSSSSGRIFIFRASEASWMAAPGTGGLAKKTSMLRSRYGVVRSREDTRRGGPRFARRAAYVGL